ncbi:hypothetical protein BDZ45DRAFT_741546 [Acephala macrosclerotiorum]|nr:hypothetical protein BDZ45DRAFT_741546 [Acephala macrosclerotiorum]
MGLGSFIAKFALMAVILVLAVVVIGWLIKRKMQGSKDENTLPPPIQQRLPDNTLTQPPSTAVGGGQQRFAGGVEKGQSWQPVHVWNHNNSSDDGATFNSGRIRRLLMDEWSEPCMLRGDGRYCSSKPGDSGRSRNKYYRIASLINFFTCLFPMLVITHLDTHGHNQEHNIITNAIKYQISIGRKTYHAKPNFSPICTPKPFRVMVIPPDVQFVMICDV